MPFLTTDLEFIDSPSEKEFRLKSDLVWEHPDGGRIVVPAGFPTDLYSVPGVLQWAYQRVQKDNRPAVLHDFLVKACFYKWDVAADIMYESMKESFSRKERALVIGSVKFHKWMRTYPTVSEIRQSVVLRTEYQRKWGLSSLPLQGRVLIT